MIRAQAFNKNYITSYFTALGAILGTDQLGPENIFNVNELGLSTVKIFATKGHKLGQHLTVVCAMNTVSTFVPPAFIFPQKRFKKELMDNCPIGSIAFYQENEWMSSELILKWLQHFVHYMKISKENKALLLLDGHSSHKSLEVLEYTENNGIILFCFPTHCTHRVQPLDVGFFNSLQIYYDQEI